MSTKPPKTIALFGATGGTGLATLRLALQNGNTVNVLARTPSKLSALSAQYPDQLHIVEGDIHSLPLVKQTLVHAGKIVDVIISCVGMVLHMKGLGFTSSNPHICEESAKLILEALSEIENEKKAMFGAGGPLMVLLSGTGISDRGRDIPIGMIPLYHWMLPIPHDDKKKMEEVMERSGRRWVLIRPSFLKGGHGCGMKGIRVSTETPGLEATKETGNVAIGYLICREDVGLWMVEECVKENATRWEGKIVTLTH